MIIKYFTKANTKLIYMLLAFTLIMMMTACNGDKGETAATESPAPTQETRPTAEETPEALPDDRMPGEDDNDRDNDQPTTEPTTEPENEDASDPEQVESTSPLQAYADYLKNWEANNNRAISGFALFDIDSNGVPELIIKPAAGSRDEEGLRLISVSDDGMIELGSYSAGDRSDIEIYPGIGGFEFNGAKDSAVYTDAYLLKNYELSMAYSYRYSAVNSNDAGASPLAFYYVGAGQVTADEYLSFVENFKRGGAVKLNLFSMSGARFEDAEAAIMNADYAWSSPVEVTNINIMPTPVPEADAEDAVPTVGPEMSVEVATPTSTPESTGEYILPDSSSRVLTEADLEGLTKEQLRIARNELYARNGRLFLSEDLQTYFNGKSWYNGTINPNDFSDSMLNEFEKQNLQIIQKAEQQ